ANTAGDGSALMGKVAEHLHAKRYASADTLLERHLDVALTTLRERNARSVPTEAELRLARVLDARLQHPADDGWQAYLQGRGRGGLARAEETLVKAQECAR